MIFQAVRGTFKKQKDGSASFVLNCPFPGCCKDYRVSWTQYKSGYKPKVKDHSKICRFKWYFSTLCHHILEKHKRVNEVHHSNSDTENIELNRQTSAASVEGSVDESSSVRIEENEQRSSDDDDFIQNKINVVQVDQSPNSAKATKTRKRTHNLRLRSNMNVSDIRMTNKRKKIC